jgi:hypothetical protein
MICDYESIYYMVSECRRRQCNSRSVVMMQFVVGVVGV